MSTKRLRSVIQSTAHHALSGLCYVHPHLGQVCRTLGINSVCIDLLEPRFFPELGAIPKELTLSTDALREKFSAILESENISQSDVEEAYAEFEFVQSRWPVGCCVKVIDSRGNKMQAAVGSDGGSAEVLCEHS